MALSKNKLTVPYPPIKPIQLDVMMMQDLGTCADATCQDRMG